MDNGIVNIHGREYKTVALRVNEFRTAHPDWTISCDILERNDTVVVVRASIIDAEGRTIATGHAEEFRSDGKINKTSALENAESSAVGRALYFYGIGGSEIASADEAASAVSGQKPAAPKAPSPLDLMKQWGIDNASRIERCGLSDKWIKSLASAKVESLGLISLEVWGVDNEREILNTGHGPAWQKALQVARLDELRKIKAQVIEATK